MIFKQNDVKHHTTMQSKGPYSLFNKYEVRFHATKKNAQNILMKVLMNLLR